MNLSLRKRNPRKEPREPQMTTSPLTALVTGGTSGIGRATANKLAELGIYVLVVGRNWERGEKAVAEIRSAVGKADFIASDLRDASTAREVAKRAVELGSGQVDILINSMFRQWLRLRSVRHEPLRLKQGRD